MRNYYEILGVTNTADADTIKKAYRKLAMQWHPDKYSGDNPEDAAKRFAEIQEAYETIGDEYKRSVYDKTGVAPKKDNRKYPQRGSDITLTLLVTLEEIYHPTIKVIEFIRAKDCLKCNCTGLKAGCTRKVCKKCKGSGYETFTMNMSMVVRQPCTTCLGRGSAIWPEDACPECRDGLVEVREQVRVEVPHGALNGEAVTFMGMGNSGRDGGATGSLYVIFRVQKHEVFDRVSATDLRVQVPVSFTTMLLGGDIEVPSMKGILMVRVPPETQIGQTLRIDKQGYKNKYTQQEGCLLVSLDAQLCSNMTEQQKRLLNEFATIENNKKSGVTL